MKRLVFCTLCLTFVLSAVPVFAMDEMVTTQAQISPSTAVLPATTKATTTTKSATSLEVLQTRATGEIDRRLMALQEGLTKVSGMKKIADAEKQELTTAIQSEITKLTDLKTKISSATDVTTLKTDTATIVTQYRIFALFLPKIHLLAAADVLGTTIDELTILATKLETRITAAETAGMSVTALKTTHTAMLDKIADAKKQYESILTNVTPLTPDGYPGNRSTLTSARTLLSTARKNLMGAATDARSIMTSLKAFRPGEATPTVSSSSAAPSMTPRALAPSTAPTLAAQ